MQPQKLAFDAQAEALYADLETRAKDDATAGWQKGSDLGNRAYDCASTTTNSIEGAATDAMVCCALITMARHFLWCLIRVSNKARGQCPLIKQSQY